MAAWFAYPKPLTDVLGGTVLTFIVPAPNGCNLKCPYCVISQRGERSNKTPALSPTDYAWFVTDVARHVGVACVAIQGEEPLLTESLPYTLRIIEEGRRLGLPTSIVTNGTMLESNVEQLAELELSYLAVSLDGVTAAVHDKLRGVVGTFDAATTGLRRAARTQGFEDRVLVSSVLLPGKVEYLLGMADFLASVGVRQWYVSPVLRIGEREAGGPIANDLELIRSLRTLQDEAVHAGISISVCDDFDQLYELRRSTPALRNLKFKTLSRSEGILRLLPTGACDVGEDILARHSEGAAVWSPRKETPFQFFLRLINPENCNARRHDA